MNYKITRKIHFKAESDKPVSVVAISQRSCNPDEQIEVLSNGALGKEYIWRTSNDNGLTWLTFQPDGIPPTREELDKTKVISHWQAGLYFGETQNILVLGWMQTIRDESIIAHLDKEAVNSRKMYYQISRDGGKSWGNLCPLIQEKHCNNNWLKNPDLHAGFSDFNQGVSLDDDRIIFPAYKFCLFPETESIEDKDGKWRLASGCISCKSVDSHFKSSCSQWLTLDRDKSSRGLCEPTITKLSDGRILMLIRAGKPDNADFPGVKFYSISEDDGMTWSEPVVLTYEDGSPMYSSSSMVQVFRWESAGGIYLITNIVESDDLIRGCDPRDSIQIAKLNEETLCVEKDSITVIENRRPDQAPNIRFSNFLVIEDKQTGALKMYMTACPGDVGKKPGDNVSLDSYEYIINAKRTESDD